MTQELIPLTISAIGNEEQKTVNARDLHAFLEVKTRFNDWIERRIADFGFVESIDFVSVTQKRVTGGTQTDYFLSLSMAKEIAMVERNAKGKQARLYFIECEKIAKAKVLPTQFQIPQTMQEALRLAADQMDKNAALQKQIEADAPKVSAYDDLVDDTGLFTATAVAKILHMKRCDLFTWLKRNQVAYQQGKDWLPYSSWEKKQWAVMKIRELDNKKTGEPITSRRLRFTAAGIFQMHKMMQAQKINVPEQLDLDI